MFRQLQIVDAEVGLIISEFAALYFGMLYVALIDLNVMVLLWHQVVPFEVYLQAPFVDILGTSVAIVVFSFLIQFTDKSHALKRHFQKVLVRNLNGIGSFKFKEQRKIFRAMRPISLSYGGCGTFTKRTRMDYFHTLIVNSANAVIGTEMVSIRW
ncbi:unnamed protein product [Orchesella dallaii]|uniref:Uncharacterized protein n=1 Tax=Orchesella dallaii TaxID=48710 RepID=A0ABP1RBB3_9HEXA